MSANEQAGGTHGLQESCFLQMELALHSPKTESLLGNSAENLVSVLFTCLPHNDRPLRRKLSRLAPLSPSRLLSSHSQGAPAEHVLLKREKDAVLCRVVTVLLKSKMYTHVWW